MGILKVEGITSIGMVSARGLGKYLPDGLVQVESKKASDISPEKVTATRNIISNYVLKVQTLYYIMIFS